MGQPSLNFTGSAKKLKWLFFKWKYNLNLSFDVIAVGCHELGLLLEAGEVIVEVGRVRPTPVKDRDDDENNQERFHLEKKILARLKMFNLLDSFLCDEWEDFDDKTTD